MAIYYRPQSMQMLSEGLGNLLAAIIRKQQENQAMEQFQSLLQQTQKRVPVSGMGMDAIMRNEPLQFETQQDWDALTSAAAPNPMLMKLLIPFMQTKGMAMKMQDPFGLKEYEAKQDIATRKNIEQWKQTTGSMPHEQPSLSFTTETLDVGGQPQTVSVGRDPKTGKVVSREPLGKPYKQPASYTLPEVVQTRLVTTFNNDPAVRRAQQMRDNASIAKNILLTANPIGDEAIKVFMARASGEVGNLAEVEQARYGGSKAIKARLEQVASDMAKGILTPENRQFLMDLADTFERSATSNYDALARMRAKQYSRANPKLNEEDLYLLFNPTGTLVGGDNKTQHGTPTRRYQILEVK